ncbi:MAG: iron ABC transporter permease [Tissierellia bacterium]|nr:iron ABC transporter permease [Tissierellia bacterium]
MEQQKLYRGLWVGLFLVGLFLILASIFIGQYKVGASEIFETLFDRSMEHPMTHSVLFDIRIPRILMAFLVGIGLSMAGSTYQAVLMNPLASPDVLGTSSAAAFGAASGILLFPGSFVFTCLLSFFFGLVSIGMVFLITKMKRNREILTIVLSGMIVGSVFMALIAVIKYLADTEETLPAITFWLMGSFSSINMEQVFFAMPIFLLCFFILHRLRWKLNILSLGDEEAIVAGLQPAKLRIFLLAIASVIVSLSVTFAGVVGWVGLVIPHLSRTFVGYNNGRLVPISGLVGGVFLLLMDNLARSVGYAEIPIGMLTALIGAPVFMLLFLKGERS